MGWSSAIGEVAIHVLQIVGVTDSRDDVTVSAADETPRRRETVRCVAVQGCACSGVRQSRRPFSAPPSSPNVRRPGMRCIRCTHSSFHPPRPSVRPSTHRSIRSFVQA
mmetsp:Transcript_5577/g.15578  ORF Transcript_5577/g.15578 Transcript_5577/m.15578 type:complete len:108 (+) Transcript_5577:292-615(+)